MKKKISAEDLAVSAFAAALKSQAVSVDPVPPGWMTVLEIAEKLGKSREHMSHLVAAAFKRGELEKKTFRILTGRGPYPVPHYRVVKK